MKKRKRGSEAARRKGNAILLCKNARTKRASQNTKTIKPKQKKLFKSKKGPFAPE